MSFEDDLRRLKRIAGIMVLISILCLVLSAITGSIAWAHACLAALIFAVVFACSATHAQKPGQ